VSKDRDAKHCFDQADEFTLIGCQLGMMQLHCSIEKRKRPFTLMQDCADARPRRITIHNESFVEVWQLKYWSNCESFFQGFKFNGCR
jgi:hypothetical protein